MKKYASIETNIQFGNELPEKCIAEDKGFVFEIRHRRTENRKNKMKHEYIIFINNADNLGIACKLTKKQKVEYQNQDP